MSYHVVWFKRDLRLHDHVALHNAARRGPVLCLYVVEPELWRQPDAARQHYEFVRESLADLQRALHARGGQLLVAHGEITEVLARLWRAAPFAGLYSHEETGNGWSYARDRAVVVAATDVAGEPAVLHDVRHQLAAELAPLVRVNGLAPATVVEGSAMFPRDRVIGSLTKYNIPFSEDETTEALRGKLAAFYAERTLTKSPITLADQAEAAYLLASSKLSKTTGQIVSVDGGLAEAFLR